VDGIDAGQRGHRSVESDVHDLLVVHRIQVDAGRELRVDRLQEVGRVHPQ